MKILKRDFDAAVKQPWQPATCLIAQAVRRVYGEDDLLRQRLYEIANDCGNPSQRKAAAVMDEFDENYHGIGRTDDKKLIAKYKRGLKKLRASLPITVNIRENK